MDFNSLVATSLSVVTLATLAGLGLLRGTVTNLRENLKDAREEIADKDRRLSEAERVMSMQKADLDALARVVTGEAHWVALGNRLDEMDNELSSSLRAIKEELLEVIKKLVRHKDSPDV